MHICFRCVLQLTPSWRSYQIRFFDTIQNSTGRGLIEPKQNFFTLWEPFGHVVPYTKVSCLFTKHLLTCGMETVGGTEKLCQPKRRALIAGHSMSSTFFCTSTVCLLISQNVNKKLIEIDSNFQMNIFGTKTTKNQILRVKLLPKIIF